MFALVVFLYSFTSKRNESRKLNKSLVEFVGDPEQFVTNETVNKLLIENKTPVSALRKDALDLNSIEKTINKHGMVEKSEVFVTIDGTLKATVKQKTPIARVFDENGSFYIDYQGEEMPLSRIQSARLLLVSGEINKKYKDGLVELFRFVYNDDFLRKNITGVQIYDNGAMMMTNRNYDYKIDFGRAINIEKKFKNYMAFFQKAVQDSSINKYRKINLRFTKQVVCTK